MDRTFQTALLERRIITVRAGVRLVLGVAAHVVLQLRLVPVRNSALVADVRPNSKMYLADVLFQTTGKSNHNLSVTNFCWSNKHNNVKALLLSDAMSYLLTIYILINRSGGFDKGNGKQFDVVQLKGYAGRLDEQAVFKSHPKTLPR